MGKTDVVVRTAQDLERKYNLASLLGIRKNVELTAQGIQQIQNELNSILNTLVINLKDVLDSQSEISLWFYSGQPTLENEPYISWENPSDHIGDLYYDQSSGSVYQYKEYNGTGVWEVNVSPDLIEAMAITNSELDTAEDHERKVFFDTPKIPYSNGDWWVKEDGSLFICQISKTSGEYEENDFISSGNYTESVAEKIGNEIKVLKGTITTISENFAKFTDMETGGSTTIAGENISTGNIQSNNYINNVSGMKIDMTNGTIDTKNFKTDEEGNITCNDATINGSAFLSGEIGGFTLNGGIFASQLTVAYDYTMTDVTYIQQKIQNSETFTEEDIAKYDLNGDGVVDLKDLVLVQKYVITSDYISTTKPATFELNTNDPLKTITIKDYAGTERINISFFGLKIDLGDCVFEVNKGGVFINGTQITGNTE